MSSSNDYSLITAELFHWPLNAASRRVRLALGEKNINCEMHIERPWDPSPEQRRREPRGDVPVLIISQNNYTLTLLGANAICEYLDENIPDPPLLDSDPAARAEARRLVVWFETNLAREATDIIVHEKALKRFIGGGEPDSSQLRAAYENLHAHLDYIGWLSERRRWLAGTNLSFADLAAAAQLSVLDYLGDVPWDKHAPAREWYARIKSRRSFRPILGDYLAGLLPSRHYANVDF